MGHFKDNKKIPEIFSNYSSCLTRSKPETKPRRKNASVRFLAVLWISNVSGSGFGSRVSMATN
jgi:hypothetical protein